MAPTAPQLRVIERFFQARGHDLPAAKLAAPSAQSGLDDWGRNSAYAKGLAANEPAPSSRRQRHYRVERFAHYRGDFGRPARCPPTSQTARLSGEQEHLCTDGSRLSRRLSARASLRVGPRSPSLPLLPGSD